MPKPILWFEARHDWTLPQTAETEKYFNWLLRAQPYFDGAILTVSPDDVILFRELNRLDVERRTNLFPIVPGLRWTGNDIAHRVMQALSFTGSSTVLIDYEGWMRNGNAWTTVTPASMATRLRRRIPKDANLVLWPCAGAATSDYGKALRTTTLQIRKKFSGSFQAVDGTYSIPGAENLAEVRETRRWFMNNRLGGAALRIVYFGENQNGWKNEEHAEAILQAEGHDGSVAAYPGLDNMEAYLTAVERLPIPGGS